MTKIIKNVLFIQEEPEKMCEYCGKVSETRPYGRNNEEICFECAMKPMHKKITENKFNEVLYNE